MTDNLDTKTDRELDELFAVECAGFVRMDCDLYNVGAYRGVGARERSDGVWITNHVPFSTDANAVLPWLEKQCALSRLYLTEVYPAVKNHQLPVCWHITINVVGVLGGHLPIVGTAPTFPRAAVIALLRAKRAEKAT